MSYYRQLEAMELIMLALEKLEAGKRTQVTKQRLMDVQTILMLIFSRLDKDSLSVEYGIIIDDVTQAIKGALDSNLTVLPDEMKSAIEKGLVSLEHIIAELNYEYFTYNPFEPTDELIPILRRVVACHYDTE